MSRMRLVVHPSDFSGASRPAFAQAIETAKERRAELLLVHVLSSIIPMAASNGYMSPRLYDDIVKASRAQAQKQLDTLVAAAKKARVRARGVLLEGVAWEQLVRLARGSKADLIVMGTRGRTGLARLFLGSVAERVIGNPPCPVLTVRAAK
jgi:nucleotide-binding universal stress UspA family protein